MNFQDYLKISANEIEKEVDLILSIWSKEVEDISPKYAPLIELFIQSCQGGKRLRGALVKLGFDISNNVIPTKSEGHTEGSSQQSQLKQIPRLLSVARNDNGEIQKEILKIAAAYEIFQAAILIHDDVIDQSQTRRGKQTLYKALGGDHYAISQAIGLGDIGLYLPIKIIADTTLNSDIKAQALSFFAQAVIYTGLGEVLDVQIPHLNQKREERDVLVIHKLKTAYYTITAPLSLGVILAGGDKGLLQVLKNFGESLGIAFQIQDDILGVFGDEISLGKSVTSDIEEGKNTLLITQAMKNANDEQLKILNKYYGKGELDQEKLEQVRRVFVETGALEYSKTEAQNYVKIAKSLIPEITTNESYIKMLEQMAEYLVERSK